MRTDITIIYVTIFLFSSKISVLHPSFYLFQTFDMCHLKGQVLVQLMTMKLKISQLNVGKGAQLRRQEDIQTDIGSSQDIHMNIFCH